MGGVGDMTADQASAAAAYPIAANGLLCDPSETEAFLEMLFGNVEWQPGQVISLLGIGEKGTTREGIFRDRQIVSPGFIGVAHGHIKRWAQWHAASFIVPAVLHPAAAEKGDVTLDKVAALTAIILDLDSGDVNAKAKWVIERLGKPSIMVASGGKTETGTPKGHAYWLLSEPCEDVERVAAVRKLLAQKVGGDQSFGRATQVIRIPGSVHAKHGNATVCKILERSDAEYDFEDLADIIETMQPMPGVELVVAAAPLLTLTGGMDFTPKQDTAIAALNRDINEGGEDLTRWSEFNKTAGFYISQIRMGTLTPEAALTAANGWMLEHMNPPWPQARFDQEFRALVNKDVANHGAMPAPLIPWSNVAIGAALPLEYFADIVASLSSSWLARDLLATCALAAMYGYPGSGKSFLAVDFALRIAAGLPVDGRAVKQCPVIYIAAEGQRGLRNRVVAFRKHHNIESDLPFALIPCAVNLLNPKADLARLVEAIELAVARLRGPPGLIVVDTLAATFGGGDENTSAMIGYINNLAILRDTFEATVLLVHHRPKDAANNTPRGHGSLMGAMDTIILVESSSIARSATITKQKDAEAGAPLTFVLKSLSLGEDEEGEPVTAAVVEYRPALGDKKLAAGPAAILKSLSDAMDEAGGASVLEVVWRAQWSAEPAIAIKTDDTRRKAWERGRDELRGAGRIHAHEGRWSIPAAILEQRVDFAPGTAS
jgi:hypothetical protein